MSSKKFRTLYLHIGLEKTGTTSIQEFLEANRSKLIQDGFFLPSCLGHKNHKMLAAYAFEAGARDIAVISTGVGSSEEEVAAFRARIEAQLGQQVAESEAETAIISSEDLSRLPSSEHVDRVVELLTPYCDRLRVIVFVRRQDLLASSRYYSLVIGGSQEARVFPVNRVPYYDYHRNIGNWIHAVGEENVSLVRFPENPRAEAFNSVDRFCALLGIDPDRYARVNKQHVSFDAVNQIIIQNYNVLKGGYDHDGLKWLMSELEKDNDRQYSHIPSEKQARAFYAQYRAGNEALFHWLGIPDDLFSDDFSMYATDNMRTKFQSIAIRRLLSLLEASARPG